MTTSDEIKTGAVTKIPSGEIIATGVPEAEYMERYAADFCEWVEGTVIKIMSPVHLIHDKLTHYLYLLLEIYFDLRPIGRVVGQFIMNIKGISSKREPELQIILNTNSGKLTETFMGGPADVVIEVVSPESVERDHGEKFKEYEKGKVPEYWIIDPLRNEGRFYRLNEAGVYLAQREDAQGDYRTPALPDFILHVPTLWQEKLPGAVALVKAVQEMVGQK